jgi:hypothetical protein
MYTNEAALARKKCCTAQICDDGSKIQKNSWPRETADPAVFKSIQIRPDLGVMRLPLRVKSGPGRQPWN